ncbi:MAG: hypothetical protein ACOVS5_00305, partial [Oligoflexus sp.]
MAISDQFPKIECVGIFGEWSGRTRSNKLAELSRLLSLGVHDNPYGCQESTACSEDILQQIEKLAPQLAILVGYSSFHHRLAGYFKSQSIPVVLYEMTPGTALANLDMNEVGQRVAVALGISPRGSELVQKSGVPYFYIGCPHKDRVDRVIVEAESMGL